MFFVDAIGRMAARYQHHRAIVRTERMILAFPTEVRKDIGWPESWDVHAPAPEGNRR